MKKVLIIIVNWNGLKILKKCLKSLEKTKNKSYEIVIVDNCSSDGSVEYLKKSKKVKSVLLDKNYGYDYAINKGIDYGIKNNFKFFINFSNDALVTQENWLDMVLNTFKDKTVGAVGAKIIGYDKKIQTTWYGKRMVNEIDEGQYEFVKEVEALSGVLLAYTKETLDRAGVFDDRYFFGRDDLDFCFRVRKAGLKVIYNGKIRIIHLGGYSYQIAGGDTSGKIYKSIQKGLLLFTFSHLGTKEKIKAILRVILDAFVTKKDTWDSISLRNMKFHKNFPVRFYLSIASIVEFIIGKYDKF